jgi:hypothetical protein
MRDDREPSVTPVARGKSSVLGSGGGGGRAFTTPKAGGGVTNSSTKMLATTTSERRGARPSSARSPAVATPSAARSGSGRNAKVAGSNPGGGGVLRPASALAPAEVRATMKKLVGTEAPSNFTPSGTGATATNGERRSGGSHVDAYTELVAARTRKGASAATYYERAAEAGGHANAAFVSSATKAGDYSRKVRIPNAARDASISTPLAFNLRNAALVYSGVDIMVRRG